MRHFHRAELWRFLRFCTVGVANTVLHLMVVYALVELLMFAAPLANALAFVVANLFSFFANSRWTFQQSSDIQRYLRFVAVSCVGLAISWLSVVGAQSMGFHYMLGVVVSVVAVALSGYILNRLFVFR